jgi:hypothetical protein
MTIFKDKKARRLHDGDKSLCVCGGMPQKIRIVVENRSGGA